MRNILSKLAIVSVIAVGTAGVGCTANVHDNTLTITDPKVTFTTDVDVNNVTPGQDVAVKLSAQNVYLVEPTATPPAEHASDAGHFQIYLDDESAPPLVITANVNVSVKIPASTPPGPHKIICRVHKHDGTPTPAVQEIDITVKVSVTTGGGSDAGTGDAGVTTPSDAATGG